MRYKTVYIYLILILVCYSYSLFAQKTDTVILNNGDHLTGEIVRLEYAKVEYKTDAMSTIFVRWEDIVYIKSDKNFQIELEAGFDRFGMIETDTLSNELIIGILPTAARYPMSFIVGMIPIKEEFWDKFKMVVDLGFSYDKASDILKLDFSGNASLRTKYYLRELSFSLNTTTQSEAEGTQNHDFNLSVNRFYTSHWFINWFAGAQKQTELSLDLRILGGITAGRNIIYTNNTVLSASIGAQANREWTTNVEQAKTNAEGVIIGSLRKFKHTSPKLDWTTDIKAYPSLSTKGRYRLDFHSKLRWEIISDLNWGVTLKYNFDSKSLETNAKVVDYSIIFSLGYSIS